MNHPFEIPIWIFTFWVKFYPMNYINLIYKKLHKITKQKSLEFIIWILVLRVLSFNQVY